MPSIAPVLQLLWADKQCVGQDMPKLEEQQRPILTSYQPKLDDENIENINFFP